MKGNSFCTGKPSLDPAAFQADGRVKPGSVVRVRPRENW
jgi:hypothetical protein